MITWLTPEIGTAAHHEVADDPTVESVLVDVRELVDRGGNPAGELLARIDQAAAVARAKGRVVVACDAGISRSRVVAIGAMVRAGWAFDDAVAHVRTVADKPELNLPLLRSLSDLLADRPAGQTRTGTTLVLGGGGFIGSAVTAWLRGSRRVLAPRRAEIDLLTDAVELDRLVRREGVQTIVNAALAHPLHSARAAGANLTMVRNVLDVAEGRGTRVIHLSTLAVFSGSARAASSAVYHATEEAVPMPAGTYSEGKRLGELLVEWFRDRGGSATIVRPTSVYGSGMPPNALVPKLIRLARGHRPITTHVYRNGPPSMDLVHVEDLSRAIADLVAAEDPPSVAHVATGQPVTTGQLAELIVELTGSRSPLATTAIEQDAHVVTDARLAALQRLGWYPQTSLRDGLSSLLKGLGSWDTR